MGHSYSRLKCVGSQKHINGGTGEMVQGRGLKLWLRIRFTRFQVPVPQLNFVTLAKLLVFQNLSFHILKYEENVMYHIELL